MNGVADNQSLTSAEDYSLADSGHGLSEDSDHSRLALSTFRPKWKQPRSLTPRTRVPQTSTASDDTGIYIVETAERRAAEVAGGVGPWATATARPSYGNNLASGWANSDKLSRYKSWQPASTRQARSVRGSEESSPSATQLKRATPAASAQLGRTGGRSAERTLKKNNEDYAAALKNHAPVTLSSLPPVPPSNPDVQRFACTPPSPPSSAVESLRRAAAAEQNLSPVASSTDANVSDLDSSTSGSFLMLGPHGTSRLACVSEL